MAHGNFSITRKYTTLRSSQLQEMMVRNRQMLGGFFLYNSEDSFLNSPHRDPKRLKVMSGFNGFLTSDRFGEHQCLDCLLWFCSSRNGRSRGASPRQVLPVLSLSSGFSIAGPCCSHSSPSSSHWPHEGPFFSWLDRSAASLPSESCTQRCLCQPRSPGGSDGWDCVFSVTELQKH